MARDSGKKVSRAARAGGKVRSAQSRSLLFPGFITAVVVIGVLLVVLSLDENEASSEPPMLGDHWHAAYGINVCGDFLPPFEDAVGPPHHLHSHGDGLIHIHPSSSAATGTNATLGLFAETLGMDISSDELDLPGDFPDVSEGDDDCDGEEADLRLAVWKPTDFNQAGQATAWDDEPTVITADLEDYRPQDNELVTIAFLPPGEEIPQPPSIAALAAPADEGGPATPNLPPPTTAADDGSTDTTTADGTSDTTTVDGTDTTTAEGDTTETTEGSG